MRYQIIKNWKGKTLVKFACGQCGSKLSEQIERAGKPDICPACGTNIVIPGRKELDKRRAAAAEKKREAEQRKAEREEEARVRQAEARERQAAADSSQASQFRGHADSTESSVIDFAEAEVDAKRLPSNIQIPDWNRGQEAPGETPVPNEENSWSGPINPATDQTADEGQPDHRGRWQPEPTSTSNDQADPKFNAPSNSLSAGTRKTSPPIRKNWWRDSISLGDIRETRYPALMAYRNLMVIVWMIFTTIVCIAILVVPFLFGLPYINENSSGAKVKNAELRQLRAAEIENALATAGNDTGMDQTKLTSLRSALSSTGYDTPTYMYGDSLTPAEVSQFARSYIAWRVQRTAKLQAEKPSLLVAVAYAAGITVLYWIILLGAAILYTILLLVPPECIKLAIDVEHGIRTMHEPSD